MPTDWELPSEMFDLNLRKSENPTVNLCDAIVRKVNLLNENFLGHRKPEYMKNQFTPRVVSKENTPGLPLQKYNKEFKVVRSCSVP